MDPGIITTARYCTNSGDNSSCQQFFNEFFAEVQRLTSSKMINFGADLDQNLLCSEV